MCIYCHTKPTEPFLQIFQKNKFFVERPGALSFDEFLTVTTFYSVTVMLALVFIWHRVLTGL